MSFGGRSLKRRELYPGPVVDGRVGTGVSRPLARFAVQRADQVMVVSTAEWITANVVLSALDHIRHDRTTLVLNRARPRLAENVDALENASEASGCTGR